MLNLHHRRSFCREQAETNKARDGWIMDGCVKVFLISFILPFSSGYQVSHLDGFRPDRTVAAASPKHHRRIVYDLGSDKNPPVSNSCATSPVFAKTTHQFGQQENVCVLTRFLIEHESTRVFPAPERPNNDRSKQDKKRDRPRPSAASTNNPIFSFGSIGKMPNFYATKRASPPGGGKRKCRNKQPYSERRLQDCLPIIYRHVDGTSKNKTFHVVMLSSRDHPKLDLNTVWVEMLLHNQQSKELG
mmetsp:Transcript_22564/g.36457  ORF Transcript_22564/g.36457 Transcript_22564/m.36457 type:complete len:245 (+) Transcript_22564:131-865(+)